MMKATKTRLQSFPRVLAGLTAGVIADLVSAATLATAGATFGAGLAAGFTGAGATALRGRRSLNVLGVLLGVSAIIDPL